MEINEFYKTTKPKRKDSVLKPYLGDLKRLKSDGFTYEQMQEYLRSNGVVVIIPTILKYLKRHSKELENSRPAFEGVKKPMPQKEEITDSQIKKPMTKEEIADYADSLVNNQETDLIKKLKDRMKKNENTGN